jgi:hypothetical protein
VAANGTVAATYYDFRFNGDGPGLLTDYWLVEGQPGTDLTNPANWGNEARLTNTSFDLEKASVRRGFFIGDYQGFAAAGNDFDAFFAATNGTDPGDIFFRDPPAGASTRINVPINDLPSSPTGADSVFPLASPSLVASSLATSSNPSAIPITDPALRTTQEATTPKGEIPSQVMPAAARVAAVDQLFTAAGREHRRVRLSRLNPQALDWCSELPPRVQLMQGDSL